MKRYAIFEFGHHYPNGGMGDYKNSFDTIEEAINFCETELNLIGENLKRIIEDMGYTCEIWDIVEIKKVWSIYKD